MALFFANLLVCLVGASVCIVALISKHANTSQPTRLFAVSLMCTAFALWMISGAVSIPDIRIENVIPRGLAAAAAYFALRSMIEHAKKHGE